MIICIAVLAIAFTLFVVIAIIYAIKERLQNAETKYNYEDVCEIVASSNDFINETIYQYQNN